MKKLIIPMILFFSLNSFAFDWTQADKKMHMEASYNLAAAGYHTMLNYGFDATTARVTSIISSMLVGLVKEYAVDRTPDRADLEANMTGIAVAAIIPFEIRF